METSRDLWSNNHSIIQYHPISSNIIQYHLEKQWNIYIYIYIYIYIHIHIYIYISSTEHIMYSEINGPRSRAQTNFTTITGPSPRPRICWTPWPSAGVTQVGFRDSLVEKHVEQWDAAPKMKVETMWKRWKPTWDPTKTSKTCSDVTLDVSIRISRRSDWQSPTHEDVSLDLSNQKEICGVTILYLDFKPDTWTELADHIGTQHSWDYWAAKSSFVITKDEEISKKRR